jgi:hypothetical protein
MVAPISTPSRPASATISPAAADCTSALQPLEGEELRDLALPVALHGCEADDIIVGVRQQQDRVAHADRPRSMRPMARRPR